MDSADLGPAMSLHYAGQNAIREQEEHILQFFAYGHLPPHLQPVSKLFGEMAELLVSVLPRNPERSVALRKLLESKDAAVRAFVAK